MTSSDQITVGPLHEKTSKDLPAVLALAVERTATTPIAELALNTAFEVLSKVVPTTLSQTKVLSSLLQENDVHEELFPVLVQLITSLSDVWTHFDQRLFFPLVQNLAQIGHSSDILHPQLPVLLKLLRYGLRIDDPLVCSEAAHALARLIVNGIDAGVEVPLVLPCVYSQHPEVRLAALHLLWAMRLPLSKKLKHASSKVRKDTQCILRDIFLVLCLLVNDNTPKIRNTACLYIGTMDQIDEHLLMQTLRKELNEVFSQKGNKGKADDKTPFPCSGHALAMNIVLSGGFVLGVEDEFAAVRNAAVDAVSDLVMISPPFARKSLDFLVDILNDESESVRLNSIHSLRRMAHNQPTSVDAAQVESLSIVLRDSDQGVRHAAHRLLGALLITTQDTLRMIITFLDNNLRRFPNDKMSLYACLHDIGRNCAELIDSMVYEILKLDPRFLPQEVQLEDDAYIGRLLFIFGAYSKGVLKHKLPLTVMQHLPYLRAKFPFITSSLPASSNDSTDKTNTLAMDVDTPSSRDVIIDQPANHLPFRIIKTVKMATALFKSGPTKAAETVLQDLQREILSLSKSDPTRRGVYRFCKEYINCCIMILQIRVNISKQQGFATTQELASRILCSAYSMELTYMGITPQCTAALHSLRQWARQVWVVAGELQGSDDQGRAFKDEIARTYLRDMADPLQAFDLPTMLASIQAYQLPELLVPSLLRRATSGISLPRVDQPITTNSEVLPIPTPHATATIVHPLGHAFGGSLKVQISGIIRNIPSLTDIYIHIRAPGSGAPGQLYLPSPTDQRPFGPAARTVDANIEVRIPRATEPCELTFAFARIQASPCPQTDMAMTSAMRDINGVSIQLGRQKSGGIVICELAK
ncbi:armadillo-type protein [Phlyctochytrium arcticum]|nr:armadillo-type protein [Phlyctochytrium arcticum]